MRIKEVKITGFRSYKDNTHVYGFSPRSNVVVGRNGSGKSNFFHAIQFVLSDEYSHLKEEQRLGLLHESTGPKVAHARVEIIFDNSEKRIMGIDAPEVKIVRQVGKKKDQYYIDNKMVPRAEVVNLMESAGFSRSNPYYIVKQGKINELATSPDAYKLKLLREVAGTRVYDERKEESLKILKETKMKTEKIEGLLKYIDERLQTLENEKEDLKEYQKLDKTKRSIEYTMYDNQNKEAIKEKEKVDKERMQEVLKDNEIKVKLAAVVSELNQLRSEQKKLEAQFRGHKDEKEALTAEHLTLQAKHIELGLEIKTINEDAEKEQQGRTAAEVSMQTLTDEIYKKETELDEIKPEYAKLMTEESALMTDIRIDESRIKEMLAKQGQKTQFASVDERDRFLRQQIRDKANLISDNQEQVNIIEKEMKDAEKEEEQLNADIGKISRDIDQNRLDMDNAGGNTSNLKHEFDQAYNALQTAHREEKSLRDRIITTEADVNNAADTLKKLIARPVYNGIQGVKKVMEEFKRDNRNDQHKDVIEGYHGILIDLIDVPATFVTAVEVIAQNRLFYHVVSTDRIASKIMRKFNDMQLPGELNFFPMNRISVPRLRDAQQTATSRPMIDVIDNDAQFEKVVQSITANVIIVKALDETARAFRNDGFDVVSMDGDQMSKKGVMTGGFIDNKRNKLEIHMQQQKLQEELEELKKALKRAELNVREATQNADQARSRMNQNENHMEVYHRKHRDMTDVKNSLSQQFFMVSRMKEPKKNQLIKIKDRLRELLAQKECLEQDIGSALESQLSTEEEQSVRDLRKKVDEMKQKLTAVSKRRMYLTHEKNRIENLLTSKLYKTKNSLASRVDDISDNERRHKLESSTAQYSSLTARMETVRQQLETVNSELEEYNENKQTYERKIENQMEQQRDYEQQQRDCQKAFDKIAVKEDAVKQKREDSLKKMRQLGALPTDTFSKWQNVKQRDLEKKLIECVNDLKKYEHVNKKALDQYMTASTQKEELTKRMGEQKKSEDSIEELLKVLETRKYEAIQLTFKQVKKNFEQVFKALVPHGSGKMNMRIREARPGEEGMNSVELYEGISVLVSFVSDDGDSETREMTQLSGGQKSLVALAIIFSIQKCDPAPFYLFDEIDAALDAQHRKSVADMIEQLSDQAQFVTTTFRPELLATAEKFFGVRFRNKVSHIDSVTREQAYDFVEDDTTHG